MSFCNYKNQGTTEDEEDFIFDETAESSSDFYDELRTSSSSSIKWSSDARKQIEDDWLSIEKILYGEDPLPEDEKTREEFREWMQAFPHLRVVGKKIELPVGRQRVENIEEIIAIDPPLRNLHNESFNLLDHELEHKLSLRKSQHFATSQSKNSDLEKVLRITSGLTRNPIQKPQPIQQRKMIDRTYVIKQNSVGKKLSKIQEDKRIVDFQLPLNNHHQTSRELDKISVYSSASSSRLCPLINVKFLFKKSEDLNEIKVKSASKLPPHFDRQHIFTKQDLSSKSASIHHKNPNIIQLPPFNYDLDFPIIQGRSISAIRVRNGKH